MDGQVQQPLLEPLDPYRLDQLLGDANEVARRCGWATRNQVSTNRRRYDDFPPPRYTAGCLLWVLAEVDDWLRVHRGPVQPPVPPGLENGPQAP